MAADTRPRVYLDADVYLHVLLEQEHADISSSVLQAAARGDIQLVASRLLTVEVGGWGGNRPGPDAADQILERFLDTAGTEWVELDTIVAGEARRVAWEHELRAGDAVHLATALRRKADYFMSYDKRFPYGKVIDGTQVVHPQIVWQPTLVD